MLQAVDIKSQSFKKGLFGYKPAEVENFKDTVYRAYDELNKEHETLKEKYDKLTASMEETRLKLFELENKLQNAENVTSDDNSAAKKQADQIIKNAEAAAAEIIAKAKAQSSKIENDTPVKETVKEAPKAAPKVEEPVKESASSKFFKKVEDDAPSSIMNDDDDEIFVGEIEDARKPERMMIGDGEEEDADFEFL